MVPAYQTNDGFLTTADLYDRWNGKIKMSTIIQWRYLKRGPSYRKLGGKVLYAIEDVVKFEHGTSKFQIFEEEV
jgi:hypothetical protein